jgi:hypothetical protein
MTMSGQYHQTEKLLPYQKASAEEDSRMELNTKQVDNEGILGDICSSCEESE